MNSIKTKIDAIRQYACLALLLTSLALLSTCAPTGSFASPWDKPIYRECDNRTPGRTFLETAIRKNDRDAMEDYFRHGGYPDVAVPTDLLHRGVRHSLLSLAIIDRRPEMARLLLRNGASREGVPREYANPLWWAANKGDILVATELLKVVFFMWTNA